MNTIEQRFAEYRDRLGPDEYEAWTAKLARDAQVVEIVRDAVEKVSAVTGEDVLVVAKRLGAEPFELMGGEPTTDNPEAYRAGLDFLHERVGAAGL